MANIKISALPSLTAVLDTTLVPVVESSTTQQVTGLKLKNYVFSGTGTTLPSTVVASSLTTVGKLTNLLAGTGADFSRFTNARVVLSQANTSHSHTNNTGVVGEAVAHATDTTIWGVGVYGRGNAQGVVRSAGVLGDGGVTNTADTGSAIGVRGYAEDTHAGGLNVGIYASATNSAVNNYALYMNAGDIYSGAAQTWTLNGALSFSGAYSITVSGDVIGIATQNVFNTISTTVNAFGAATTSLKIGASNAPITGFAATATTTSTAASLGYIGMPQQSKSSAYTTVIGDAGKHIYVTATATITIDSNANVAYPIGTTIAFIAAAGATVTIAITTDTMYLGGTGTTGSRTLAAYGMATAVKVTSTSWFINGTGLT